MLEVFTVLVGYTTTRPVVPDQHFAWVVVATEGGPTDAKLVAAQMAACHSEMPTSTSVIDVRI